MPTPGGRWVILLRAVNVGGSSLQMTTFRAALEAAGCARVESVGASGNAVAEPPDRSAPASLEASVEREVARLAGVRTEAFVRPEEDWRAVVAGNPFLEEAERDPAHLVVAVLKGAPSVQGWARLREAIVGRERVAPGDRHGYLVYPDGIGRSKLTIAVIERTLGARGTVRNWNTVRRLAELAADGAAEG